MRRALLRVPLLCLTLLAPSLALAGGQRILLPDIDVPGKPPKPEVTIFVTRQNLQSDLTLDLRASFIPKIVESAEALPAGSGLSVPVQGR